MSDALRSVLEYPLLNAIFGRRARRFGLGMRIPSGPLAFTSRHASVPLSELERILLLAVGTGVSGWSFGVPYGPDRPDEHGHYSVRYTGCTAPTAGGFGTPAMLFTDDEGTFLTDTRDVTSERMREFEGIEDDAERLMAVVRAQTVKLSGGRLDLPAAPPHMLEPNLWMANAPGSTVFMPIADASESVLALMAMVLAIGNVIVDDAVGCPAGDLELFIRGGVLSAEKRVPLSVLQQVSCGSNCSGAVFMAHNVVLTMQAMGLGGLYFAGLNCWSVLGAFAGDGIRGFGFRFERDERWTLLNPVGLDGHFEGMCPPYYADMRAVVVAFVERKFAAGGTYDPSASGAWRDTAAVRSSVARHDDAFVECLGEVAQYVQDTYGKCPGSFTTIALPGFVQAVHLDTAFYDEHYREDAYLGTHAEHMRRWHG